MVNMSRPANLGLNRWKVLLKSKWRIAGLASILILAAFLLTYHLIYWPTPFYDEGMNLQTAKNLAVNGKYGIQSSEGFRMFDPLASTGPTVILPIALVFKLFGIGLIQARSLIVFFAILALVSLYLLSAFVFDTKTAFIALLLTLGIPLFSEDSSASFIGLGRYVLGEIPNLLLIIVGCLLWFIALNRNNLGLLLGAGILFGLATITKDYSLLIILALVLILISDRLWYHQIYWRQVAIPIGVSIAIFILWSYLQTYLKDPFITENDPILYGITTRAFIGLFRPSQIIHNARVFLASGMLIWGVPGLMYGIYSSKDRSLIGVERAFLLSIIVIWLVWFMIGSIGWLRYAFVGICLMQIFTAKLFVDLFSGFVSSFWKPNKIVGADWLTKQRFQELAIGLVLILLVVTPLQQKIKEILSATDNSPFEFASYIRTQIDSEEVIESFEPEIVFLADNNFHQPSHYMAFKAIRHAQFGEPYPSDMLGVGNITPKYLVNGFYSKWTGLYDEWIKSGQFVLVTTVGDYDLYRAVKPSE